MKIQLGPVTFVLSAVVFVVWLSVPHAGWIDKEDLAYLDVVRSDMERLMAAEDSFKVAQGHYASSLDTLGFEASTPDITLELKDVTDSGYAVSGTHAQALGSCGVFVGSAPSPLRGIKQGAVTCR